MTCDLIIGNGAGVALATEVVPTSSRYEGSDPTTTMLGLPQPHAVGIVIRSGSSTIFGVPYETHLENWIQTLPKKPLGRLGAYAKSFRSHLEEVISANVSDIEVMRDFIWSWHDWLCKVRGDLERDGALSTEGVARFFEARAERFVNGERITSEELSKRVYAYLGRGSRKNLLGRSRRGHTAGSATGTRPRTSVRSPTSATGDGTCSPDATRTRSVATPSAGCTSVPDGSCPPHHRGMAAEASCSRRSDGIPTSCASSRTSSATISQRARVRFRWGASTLHRPTHRSRWIQRERSSIG